MEWLNELTNLITTEIPLRDEKKSFFPFQWQKSKESTALFYDQQC